MNHLLDEIKAIIKRETIKDAQGDLWSYGNSDILIAELIDKEEKKISNKNIQETLNFFASHTYYPCFMDIILKKFPLKPEMVENFLEHCLKNKDYGSGYVDSALRIIDFYSSTLTNNSLQILLEFGKTFQNEVLKSIITQIKKTDILNSPTKCGLSLAEIVLLNKNYRMSLEIASLGGKYERIFLACPSVFTQLRPSFFCSRNHNDIKLRMVMSDASHSKDFNILDFKPIFEAIVNNEFSKHALTLLAKNVDFKQRIFDYVGTLSIQEQKSLLESFSQKTSPFYEIYNTPRGNWRKPNPSHGFQKKILDKYIQLGTKKEEVKEVSEEKIFTLKKS